MGSTFSGIELGKRALQVQRKSLDVTGHNISNANTEGYSRQEAIHSTNRPHTIRHGTGAGQVGTGVKIDEIKRVRDKFIDGQIKEETSAQGKWEVKNDALGQIELIFNEPSDKSLRNSMDEFWNSLQELNNNPESEAVRATVRQRALSLTDTFNHLDDQLRDYRTSLNNQIKTKVDDINSYGQRIADLNAQISRVESMGQNANDLRDERDLLVEKLSKITSVQTKEMDNGAVTVNIEGQSLVWQDEVSKLKTVETVSSDPKFDKTVEVRWDKTNEEVKFTDGGMKGLLKARDEEVPKYVEQLNNMTDKLATEFNQQHRAGYGLNNVNHVESTKQIPDSANNLGLEGEFAIKIDGETEDTITINTGDSLADIQAAVDGVSNVNANINSNNILEIDGSGSRISLVNNSASDEDNILRELGIGAGRNFFSGNTAKNIDLTDTIKEDGGLTKIAAASKTIDSDGNGVNDYAGDGSNALNLAQIGDKKVFSSGTADFGNYYGSNISKLGVDSQRAGRMVDNQEVLTKNLKQQRDSISGVSLDEEMSKMIKYQQSYTAAAKFTSTMDEILNTLVNGIKR